MKKYSFESKFMQLALQEAQKAFNEDEVPVGCVIVNSKDNNIITTARNLMQQNRNPNSHAEILAINSACLQLESKNLAGYNIYITLEPCIMCAAAISNARISKVYYAASDEKQGAIENGLRFFNSSGCFHRPEVYNGILEEESVHLMKNFFSQIRRNKL